MGPTSPRRWYVPVLMGGVIAGALDMTDALVVFGLLGVPPARIPQSIASGLLGAGAYEGGAATVALGTALHFFIAITIAAVYVVASTRVPVLARRPVVCGLIFGIGVFVVMQYGVVPLSRARTPPLSVPLVVNGVLIHAVGVGLPIALVTARWHRARSGTPPMFD